MSIDIFRTGLNSILTKTLGMKPGSSAPAPILTPEISPTLALEVDRPEWKYLGGEYMIGTYHAGTCSAGGLGAYWAVNPAGSGVLFVCDHFQVAAQGFDSATSIPAFDIGYYTEFAGQDSQGGFAPWDARADNAGANVSPILIRFKAATVNQIVLSHRHALNATAVDEFDLIPNGYPVIVPPGYSVVVNVYTAADALSEVAVAGRVRALQPNELVGS